jgi:hypothetical protein
MTAPKLRDLEAVSLEHELEHIISFFKRSSCRLKRLKCFDTPDSHLCCNGTPDQLLKLLHIVPHIQILILQNVRLDETVMDRLVEKDSNGDLAIVPRLKQLAGLSRRLVPRWRWSWAKVIGVRPGLDLRTHSGEECNCYDEDGEFVEVSVSDSSNEEDD